MDQWDHKEHLDHRAAKELPELKGLLASLDRLDHREIVALQEDLAIADFLVLQDKQEIPELMVSPANAEKMESAACLASLVRADQLASVELQERKANAALPAKKVHKEPKALLVSAETLAQMELACSH